VRQVARSHLNAFAGWRKGAAPNAKKTCREPRRQADPCFREQAKKPLQFCVISGSWPARKLGALRGYVRHPATGGHAVATPTDGQPACDRLCRPRLSASTIWAFSKALDQQPRMPVTAVAKVILAARRWAQGPQAKPHHHARSLTKDPPGCAMPALPS